MNENLRFVTARVKFPHTAPKKRQSLTVDSTTVDRLLPPPLCTVLDTPGNAPLLGVVLFSCYDNMHGLMYCVLDVLQDARYTDEKSGFYLVSVLQCCLLDSPPRFEFSRLYYAATMLKRLKQDVLHNADVYLKIEESDHDFLQPCYAYVMLAVDKRSETREKKTQRSKIWQQHLDRLNDLEALVAAAKIDEEKSKHDKRDRKVSNSEVLMMETCRRIKCLLPAMRLDRSLQSRKLFLHYELPDGTKRQLALQKEIVYVYGNLDLDTVFDEKTEMHVTVRHRCTDALMEKVADLLYTGVFSVTMSQLIVIMPILNDLRCDVLQRQAIETIDKLCSARHLSLLLQTRKFIKHSEFSSKMDTTIFKLLQPEIKGSAFLKRSLRTSMYNELQKMKMLK